jgi:hypothetical protein
MSQETIKMIKFSIVTCEASVHSTSNDQDVITSDNNLSYLELHIQILYYQDILVSRSSAISYEYICKTGIPILKTTIYVLTFTFLERYKYTCKYMMRL